MKRLALPISILIGTIALHSAAIPGAIAQSNPNDPANSDSEEPILKTPTQQYYDFVAQHRQTYPNLQMARMTMSTGAPSGVSLPRDRPVRAMFAILVSDGDIVVEPQLLQGTGNARLNRLAIDTIRSTLKDSPLLELESTRAYYIVVDFSS